MTNKISFGNGVGYKITDFNTKKKILDFLYKNVDTFKIKTSEIKEEKDLMNIKNNRYYIYPNISGKDYIFIAKKIKNIFYAVLIDKDNLKDDINLNYNSIDIIGLKIRLSLSVYDGTIFDGRLVNLGGTSIFIINDSYLINGKEIKLRKDREELYHFINDSLIIDDNMNPISFKINKLYDLSDIDTIVNDKIKNSKYNVTSLTFTPEEENVKYIHEICKVSEKNVKMSFLAKLINVDVVNLYAIDDNNEKRKIGIAHIPTIKSSHICNQHIPSDDYVKVVCKLNTNFRKWQPIEIINDDVSNIVNRKDVIDIMKNIIASSK